VRISKQGIEPRRFANAAIADNDDFNFRHFVLWFMFCLYLWLEMVRVLIQFFNTDILFFLLIFIWCKIDDILG
jgi:hypothetical protein